MCLRSLPVCFPACPDTFPGEDPQTPSLKLLAMKMRSLVGLTSQGWDNGRDSTAERRALAGLAGGYCKGRSQAQHSAWCILGT